MTEDYVRNTIVDKFTAKKNMENIQEDEDFFDRGISSLTIVELQIQIEEALDTAIPTSELMMLPTMKDWIQAYTNKIGSKSGVEPSLSVET